MSQAIVALVVLGVANLLLSMAILAHLHQRDVE